MAALADVSLSVQGGECHALVGRNGAGKSTLVGVLTGLLKPDRGAVTLHGEPAPRLGDRAAWQQRVACVYQRSMVIPTLSVAENIFLNRDERSLVRWRALRSQARKLMLEWGFDLDVDQPAGELSVERKQIVEIARALSAGARFLILDEPTASLESGAIERLFEHVRRLKENGVAILYISHHLEEIYEICDTVTVLRDGKRIVTSSVAELDHERLVSAMVGAALARSQDTFARSDGDGAVRLEVSGLSARSPLGDAHDISLAVRTGECVGLFGLRGSGAVAVADAVAGLLKPVAGTISLDGAPLQTRQGRLRARTRCRVHPGGPACTRLRADARCAREPDAPDPRPSLALSRRGTRLSDEERRGSDRRAAPDRLVGPGAARRRAFRRESAEGRRRAGVRVGPRAARRHLPDRRGRRRVEGGPARRDRRAPVATAPPCCSCRTTSTSFASAPASSSSVGAAVVREFAPPWERQMLISVAEGFGAAA